MRQSTTPRPPRWRPALVCAVIAILCAAAAVVWRPALVHGLPRHATRTVTATTTTTTTATAAPSAIAAGSTIPTASTATTVTTATRSAGSTTAPLSPAQVRQLSDLLDEHSETRIGVAVEDTASGAITTVGSSDTFTAASTAKILAACAYYHLVEQGDRTLSQDVGAYSARYQLKQMVNQSNNESWAAIQRNIGFDELSDYADSLGIEDFDVESNQLSTTDMANLLSKLYSGDLIDDTHRDQLLGWMQDTNMEQMIPSVTPSSIDVHHKYGLLSGALHDVAILSKDDTSYAVVIYTQGDSDADDLDRIKVVRDITQQLVTDLFPGETPLDPPSPTEMED